MDFKKELKLDIGCGKNKKPGFIGVDISENSDADVIASALNLPFEDASVTEINCSHLGEHFYPEQAQKFFDEIYRVLKRGGGVANLKIDKDWSEKRLLRKDSEHKYRYTVAEIKQMVSNFSQKEVKDKIYFFRWNKPRRKLFVKLVK